MRYILAAQSNLKASQRGGKLFLLLIQCENLPCYQHFLVLGDHYQEQFLTSLHFPSESNNFIKVEEGSNLLFANRRASFYPSHVWRANISIAKSLKKKKKKSCSLFLSLQKINYATWSYEWIGACKRMFQLLNTCTLRGHFNIADCDLPICFQNLLLTVKIFL